MPKAQAGMRLSDDVKKTLDRAASRLGLSRAAVVEALVRCYADTFCFISGPAAGPLANDRKPKGTT